MGQADAGDNEAKLMTKLAPEWVRTSDPVIRSPSRYRWTTAPAMVLILGNLHAGGQSSLGNLSLLHRCLASTSLFHYLSNTTTQILSSLYV